METKQSRQARLEYHRAYYLKNKKKLQKQRRAYYKANRVFLLTKQIKYNRRKRAELKAAS